MSARAARKRLEAAQKNFQEKLSEVDAELEIAVARMGSRSGRKRRRAETRQKLMARMNEILNRRSYIRNLVQSVQRGTWRRRRAEYGTHVVGIDLGTRRTAWLRIWIRQTGAPQCISGPVRLDALPLGRQRRSPMATIVVGEPARRRLLTQPDRTIYSVKRLMGRGVADVQDELKLFPFRIDPSKQQRHSRPARR